MLGLSFKPETDDIRESPALAVVADLLKAGVAVRAFDPAAMPPTRALYPDLHFATDAYDCAAGADFLVLATEWNAFRALDLPRLAGLLQDEDDDRPAQRLRPEGNARRRLDVRLRRAPVTERRSTHRMRVVVTGGAGFLGSHLVDRLLKEGHEVIAMDNLLTGNPRNLAHLDAEKRFRFVRHDVTQFIFVDGPLDAVLHFASPASPIDYLELPIQTLKVGSLGTHNALGLALEKKARFLLASTSEVYGDPLIHPQPETYWGNVNPIGPRGVYDEAKRFGEAITMAYRRAHGVDTRIVRIFNTYGERMRPRDGRVVPALIGQALAGEPMTVFGDGSQTRSFCYVSDLVDGIYRLLQSDIPDPTNIGNPAELSVLEFARRIRDLTGTRSEIVFKPLPVDDPKVRQPDITKAKEKLGWEPKVKLDEGLKRTIEYFRSL